MFEMEEVNILKIVPTSIFQMVTATFDILFVFFGWEKPDKYIVYIFLLKFMELKQAKVPGY